MNAILIETIANGWIVRPFKMVPGGWTSEATSFITAFNTVEALQAAIPVLLTSPCPEREMSIVHSPTCNPHSKCHDTLA